VQDPRLDNPYPPGQPRLRRAFDEGARAARSESPARDYVCETRAQKRAWLDGFFAGRLARTGRDFDGDLLGP
jgi:hypothetical protein